MSRATLSSRPRFPEGIQPETFKIALKFCEDIGYPLENGLALSVDDTKLFPTLQPLFDGTVGPNGTWFLVGALGGRVKIPDIDTFNEILERNSYEKAAKVRESSSNSYVQRSVQVSASALGSDSAS